VLFADPCLVAQPIFTSKKQLHPSPIFPHKYLHKWQNTLDKQNSTTQGFQENSRVAIAQGLVKAQKFSRRLPVGVPKPPKTYLDTTSTVVRDQTGAVLLRENFWMAAGWSPCSTLNVKAEISFKPKKSSVFD
jgi:hypothetical protein